MGLRREPLYETQRRNEKLEWYQMRRLGLDNVVLFHPPW